MFYNKVSNPFEGIFYFFFGKSFCFKQWLLPQTLLMNKNRVWSITHKTPTVTLPTWMQLNQINTNLVLDVFLVLFLTSVRWLHWTINRWSVLHNSSTESSLKPNHASPHSDPVSEDLRTLAASHESRKTANFFDSGLSNWENSKVIWWLCCG